MAKLDNKDYVCHEYCEQLMQKLWLEVEDEEQPVACDVLVKYNNAILFHVHSSILFCTCPHLASSVKTISKWIDLKLQFRYVFDINDVIYQNTEFHEKDMKMKNSKQSHQLRFVANTYSGCNSEDTKWDRKISTESLGSMLRFLYLGSIDLTSVNVNEVEYLAKIFKQDVLTKYCANFKSENLDDDFNQDCTIVILVSSSPVLENDTFEETCKSESIHKSHALVEPISQLNDEENIVQISESNSTLSVTENVSKEGESLPLFYEKYDRPAEDAKHISDEIQNSAMEICSQGIETNTARKAINCPVCPKTFSKINGFVKHMTRHQDGNLKCKYCDQIFSDVKSIQQHAASYHSSKTTFKCSFCFKEYVSEAGVKVHEQSTHKYMKPFSCLECGKKFSQKGHLKEHIRVHTKEKNYVCSFCGLGYCSKVNMQRHESSHTGLRPFVCTMCGKAFAVQQDLDRHIKFRHAKVPIICDVCGVHIQSRDGLSRHARLHLHECKYCSVQFTRLALLRRHEKNHEECAYGLWADLCESINFQPPTLRLPTLERTLFIEDA